MAMVGVVLPQSSAEQAGIRSGDPITAIDGQKRENLGPNQPLGPAPPDSRSIVKHCNPPATNHSLGLIVRP